MAATTAGSLKAGLEAQGWGVPWYRRRAPKEQARPFGTIREGIVATTDRSGDQGDPDAPLLLSETVQLDLWQDARLSGVPGGEVYELAARVLAYLRSARLVEVGTSHVYGVTGLSYLEVPDPDPAVVHHAFTATIRREL